jgi:hypothetical protein
VPFLSGDPFRSLGQGRRLGLGQLLNLAVVAGDQLVDVPHPGAPAEHNIVARQRDERCDADGLVVDIRDRLHVLDASNERGDVVGRRAQPPLAVDLEEDQVHPFPTSLLDPAAKVRLLDVVEPPLDLDPDRPGFLEQGRVVGDPASRDVIDVGDHAAIIGRELGKPLIAGTLGRENPALAAFPGGLNVAGRDLVRLLEGG